MPNEQKNAPPPVPRRLVLLTPNDTVFEHFLQKLGLLARIRGMQRFYGWHEIESKATDFKHCVFVLFPSKSAIHDNLSMIIDRIVASCIDPVIILITDLPITTRHACTRIIPKSTGFTELDRAIIDILESTRSRKKKEVP